MGNRSTYSDGFLGFLIKFVACCVGFFFALMLLGKLPPVVIAWTLVIGLPLGFIWFLYVVERASPFNQQNQPQQQQQPQQPTQPLIWTPSSTQGSTSTSGMLEQYRRQQGR